MQNKIRTGRSYAGVRLFRKGQIACFSACQLVFLLIFSSCGIFDLNQDKQSLADGEMKIHFQRVCLNSEGKGRLRVGRNKYLFGYSSYNDLEQRAWSLGLELPLHGEEVLTLDWSKAADEQVALDGDFYLRLLSQLRKSPKLKSLMKIFLLKTGQIIHGRDMILKNDKNFICEQTGYDKYSKTRLGHCRKGEESFRFDWTLGEQELSLSLPITNSYQYLISFQRLSETHYSHIQATLTRLKKRKKLFSLKLFLDECTSESVAQQ